MATREYIAYSCGTFIPSDGGPTIHACPDDNCHETGRENVTEEEEG